MDNMKNLREIIFGVTPCQALDEDLGVFAQGVISGIGLCLGLFVSDEKWDWVMNKRPSFEEFSGSLTPAVATLIRLEKLAKVNAITAVANMGPDYADFKPILESIVAQARELVARHENGGCDCGYCEPDEAGGGDDD